MSEIIDPDSKPLGQPPESKPPLESDHKIQFFAYETVGFDPYLVYPPELVRQIEKFKEALIEAITRTRARGPFVYENEVTQEMVDATKQPIAQNPVQPTSNPLSSLLPPIMGMVLDPAEQYEIKGINHEDAQND